MFDLKISTCGYCKLYCIERQVDVNTMIPNVDGVLNCER